MLLRIYVNEREKKIKVKTYKTKIKMFKCANNGLDRADDEGERTVYGWECVRANACTRHDDSSGLYDKKIEEFNTKYLIIANTIYTQFVVVCER